MKEMAKDKEKMNPTSSDERYNELLASLKVAMKKLRDEADIIVTNLPFFAFP